ncbi:MAG: hypothetical protein IIA45_13230 [Bacteroidetes bacterium]|nr:hypothetical protein [Bacteroidota bacterium]
MKEPLFKFCAIGMLFAFLVSCSKEKAGEFKPVPLTSCDSLHISYFWVIQESITITNCAISGCHVAGFPAGDFTNYQGIKVAVDNDTFRDRVLVKKDMPPQNSPGPKFLSALDLQRIECWLDSGAPED